MVSPEGASATGSTLRRPQDDEIDVYGLTHRGNVRMENQDHFLICSLRKHMQIHLTSLPDAEKLAGDTDRLAFLAMVADGVGGGVAGEQASRLTLEAATQYVARAMHTYYTADTTDDRAFAQALQQAALRCHAAIAERSREDPALKGMATTLSLWIGLWPWAFLLQVGDSRYYRLVKAELRQVSRDQTIAQELIDQGVMSHSEAARTRWANVLSSAIGGPQTTPVVTSIENSWDHVHMLCSDGLTKHVSDERIRDRLSSMTSARQVCQDLLQDALDGGGTDNVTIIVGRALRAGGQDAVI
jgi:PPM family protein phosphatase